MREKQIQHNRQYQIKTSFKAGVSNSVTCAAALGGKNGYAGHKDRLKVPKYEKKTVI
jgi:hypothetical protein